MHRGKLSSIANDNRIYFIGLVIFIIMSLFAPNFFNAFNFTNILKTTCLNGLAAVGFTIVMITGNLDLSVLAVINLSANITIGLSGSYGWGASISLALLAGIAVGVMNGLLVSKVKVHSFIATLGVMTIVQGFVNILTNGASVSTTDFVLTDWLEKVIVPPFTPRVIITILVVLLFEAFIKYTVYGKSFFIVGGNYESAWVGGIKVERSIISAFVISGFTSALSGTLFSLSLASAMPNFGSQGISPLIIVIAGAIIGGTSMAGGKGSVFKSMFAILTLTILFNGLICLGMGYEIQIFISGLLLAIIILFESYAIYRAHILKGQRQNLLKEFPRPHQRLQNIIIRRKQV